MVDELTPDINEKMRALCKKISVAHDLDAEIQEELYSHMEDKLLGYLNGEEALAEEDAFILVREHFGDPSTLKGLLQDVHVLESQEGLVRRLAAAMIVTTGLSLACVGLVFTVSEVWPTGHAIEFVLAAYSFIFTAPLVFLWLLLRHWQRRIDEGNAPWFLTWRPVFLVAALALPLVLGRYVPMIGLDGQAQISHFGIWTATLVLGYASPVLQCMVWLWWCDRPPRQAGAVGSAAAVWAIWLWSTSLGLNIENALAREWDLFSTAVNLTLVLFVAAMYALIAYALYAIARRLVRARENAVTMI